MRLSQDNLTIKRNHSMEYAGFSFFRNSRPQTTIHHQITFLNHRSAVSTVHRLFLRIFVLRRRQRGDDPGTSAANEQISRNCRKRVSNMNEMNVVLNSRVVIPVPIPRGNGIFCFQIRKSNHMARTIHQKRASFATNLFLPQILKKARKVA